MVTGRDTFHYISHSSSWSVIYSLTFTRLTAVGDWSICNRVLSLLTNLSKGHSVGMFSDFCQTQTLLHLSIPWMKKENAASTNLKWTCSFSGHISIFSFKIFQWLKWYLLPPRFFLCPSRGAGRGLTCFTGGGSCHLSNFLSISSFKS